MRNQAERKSHFLVGFGEAGDRHDEKKGLVSFDKGDFTIMVALGSPKDFREELVEVLKEWATLGHHIDTNWIVCHPRVHRDAVVSIIEKTFGWSSMVEYTNRNLTTDIDLSILIRDLGNRLNRNFEIDDLSVEAFAHEHPTKKVTNEGVDNESKAIWKGIMRATKKNLDLRYGFALIFIVMIAIALPVIQREKVDLIVAIDDWPGNLPGLAANGGYRTQSGSIYDSLGMEIHFRHEENHRRRWSALADKQVDIISLTLDQVIEFGNDATFSLPDIRVFLSTAWSYRGHGLVASEKTESISDLTGSVAAQKISPSYYFFRMLRMRGRQSIMALDLDERLPAESIRALKSGDARAIALGDPYLSLARETEGLKVFATNYRLPDINIQSVLVARESTISDKRELIGRFVWGWLARAADAQRNTKGFAKDVHGVWPGLLTENRLQSILMNNVYIIDCCENINLHVLDGEYGEMGFSELFVGIANSLGVGVSSNVKSAFSEILRVFEDDKSLGKDSLCVSRRRQEAIVKMRQEIYDMLRNFQGNRNCFFIKHPFGERTVQSDAYYQLRDLCERMASLLHENSEFRIVVVGRSDETGESEEKKSISLLRAHEIKRALLDCTIDPSRIVVDSKGDEEAAGTPEIDRQTKICLEKL